MRCPRCFFKKKKDEKSNYPVMKKVEEKFICPQCGYRLFEVKSDDENNFKSNKKCK